MPRKPQRPCRYPGCREYAVDGSVYCAGHKAEADKMYDDYSRSPDKRARYGRAWGKARARHYEAHPYCEECYRQGVMTQATEVHHIVPVSRGGGDEDSNLMSLCHSCHERIHHNMGDR